MLIKKTVICHLSSAVQTRVTTYRMRVHFFAYYSCTVQKVFVPLHRYTKTKNKQYKTMLTLQLIKEQRDRVISGLNKKHFNGAEEAINQVLDIDKQRRESQQQLDANLSEAKKMAAQIGGLMKDGKKDEANAIKEKVSEMKETNKQLEEQMK